MSFKSLLKEKIEREKYVEYESLLAISRAEGYKVSTMDRRMRELCNEFPIEAVEKKSKRGTMYIQSYIWKEANAWELASKAIDSFPAPKIKGYNCEVCHGKNFVESGATIAHFCEGFAIPVFAAKKKEKENFPAPFPVKKEQNKLF